MSSGQRDRTISEELFGAQGPENSWNVRQAMPGGKSRQSFMHISCLSDNSPSVPIFKTRESWQNCFIEKPLNGHYPNSLWRGNIPPRTFPASNCIKHHTFRSCLSQVHSSCGTMPGPAGKDLSSYLCHLCQWSPGTGCPERCLMPHPWRHPSSGWCRLWATCLSCSCPCSMQGRWTRWPLKFPSNSILWFCGPFKQPQALSIPTRLPVITNLMLFRASEKRSTEGTTLQELQGAQRLHHSSPFWIDLLLPTYRMRCTLHPTTQSPRQSRRDFSDTPWITCLVANFPLSLEGRHFLVIPDCKQRLSYFGPVMACSQMKLFIIAVPCKISISEVTGGSGGLRDLSHHNHWCCQGLKAFVVTSWKIGKGADPRCKTL